MRIDLVFVGNFSNLSYFLGFMSSAGIPDCSRAARFIIKDVINGKLKWVAAPPGISQDLFDRYTYREFLDLNKEEIKKKGAVLLQQVFFLNEVYLLLFVTL